MSRYICPICKNKVDEEYKIYKKRRYHINCYKEMIQELYEQEENNIPDKDKLEEYIVEIYGSITGLIDNQINSYINNKEYKYSGILLTLKYFYETLENKKTDNIKGIGIVPIYYEDAKEFFKLKNELKNNNNKAEYKKIKKNINKKEYDIENKIIDIDKI